MPYSIGIARAKLLMFQLNPSAGHLLTLDEYNSLNPYNKGYANYLQASWDESEIPDENPYIEGTAEFVEFNKGSFHAMQEVQESEE